MNVSVHSTDPALRARLFGHPSGELPILPNLRRLAAAGISVDAQVVVVPGWNDGNHLRDTLEALLLDSGPVRSVGVVPVGLTDHRPRRGGERPLRRPCATEAREVLDLVRRAQERALDELSTRWVYASDEWYLLAGIEPPGSGHYPDCPQRANGIGLIAAEMEAMHRREAPVSLEGDTIATGTMAFPFVSRLVEGTGCRVIRVPNKLFGTMVGVAGLLGGRDIISRLREVGGSPRGPALPGPRLFLPSVMFNRDGLTLDGLDARAIQSETGMRVRVLWTLAGLRSREAG